MCKKCSNISTLTCVAGQLNACPVESKCSLGLSYHNIERFNRNLLEPCFIMMLLGKEDSWYIALLILHQ